MNSKPPISIDFEATFVRQSVGLLRIERELQDMFFEQGIRSPDFAEALAQISTASRALAACIVGDEGKDDFLANLSAAVFLADSKPQGAA
ncbi:MAG: hypothetical protein WBA44_11630 [Mesorhizobium sp.]